MHLSNVSQDYSDVFKQAMYYELKNLARRMRMKSNRYLQIVNKYLKKGKSNPIMAAKAEIWEMAAQMLEEQMGYYE